MISRKIKIIISLVLLCFMMAGSAFAVSWLYDYKSALGKAKREGRPVLIDFYTHWCGWCTKMDQDTYSDKAVNAIAADFVCVKIDGDRYRDLVKKYNVRGYPTTVFLSSKGDVIHRVGGYTGPRQFERVLKTILAKYPVRARRRKKEAKDKASQFELAGIFYSSHSPKAMINNTMVGVGDVIGGAKVKKISQTAVILSYQGKDIELKMNEK